MTVPTPLPEPSQSPNWAAQLNAAITDRYEDAKQTAADVADTINTGRLSEDALKGIIGAEVEPIIPGNGERAIGRGELIVSVKDFGAIGDGVADDTAAVQAAIDSGNPIYFPPGVYRVTHLQARRGMRLIGAGKGHPDDPTTPRTAIRGVGNGTGAPILAGLPSPDITSMCSIEHLEIHAAAGANADVITGNWTQGSFRAVRLVQYRADRHVVNVHGWIDMVVDGESEISGTKSATVPLFRAYSNSGASIAQFAFRDVRFTGGGNYQLWLEVTNNSTISGVELSNVNMEVVEGGGINLLSVRHATITNSGAWDVAEASPLPFIHIGRSTGRPSGSITISEFVRDATQRTVEGVSEIELDADCFDVNIINVGEQWGGRFEVNANGATGRVSGSQVTVLGGQNMARDDMRGTGSPEGVVAASPGAHYIDVSMTAGARRWRKDTGTGNTGWRVVDGNTGWRDISDLIAPEWTVEDSGARLLRIRRVNSTIEVLGNVARAVSGGGRASYSTGVLLGAALPAGFAAAFPSLPAVSVANVGLSYGHVHLNASTLRPGVAFRGDSAQWSEGDVVQFSASYPTLQAWPTTLPGAPA